MRTRRELGKEKRRARLIRVNILGNIDVPKLGVFINKHSTRWLLIKSMALKCTLTGSPLPYFFSVSKRDLQLTEFNLKP